MNFSLCVCLSPSLYWEEICSKSISFSPLEIHYQHKVLSGREPRFCLTTGQLKCFVHEQLGWELDYSVRDGRCLRTEVWLYMYIKYANIYIYIVTIWPCNSTPMYTYWKELKTYVHIKMCTKMLTEVLLIVAPKWKQPKCLLTNKWIKENVYDG